MSIQTLYRIRNINEVIEKTDICVYRDRNGIDTTRPVYSCWVGEKVTEKTCPIFEPRLVNVYTTEDRVNDYFKWQRERNHDMC